MTAELDPRIVKVSIEVNSLVKTYEGIAITASGTKYANSLQNEAEITLSNLDKSTQDYILTQTSPYNLNRTAKTVIVEAGRVSYGTARVYSGNIVTSIVSQPPDVKITLKCLTGNFFKNTIIANAQGGLVSFQQASESVASQLGLALKFQANDKNLSNYSYSGSALQQVDNLGQVGGVNAYVDDNSLIVKNAFVPLTGTLRILSADSGMVGIPEFTEQGIKVKFLLDNKTTLGGALRIESKMYPAANGDYVIYKLGFDIANRDTPFYWIAEAARIR